VASLAVLATVCWIFDDDTALAVHSVGGGLLVNSDSLLPAALSWDVATHAYAWRGFQLPRVPSLMPDLVVSGGIQLATGSWRVAYLAYAVLLFGVLAASAGAIINSALRYGIATGALCFLAVAIPVLVFGLASPTLSLWHNNLFGLATHGGQFCVSVAGLYLVWRLCSRRGTLDFVLAFLVGALLVQSDRLSCATFIAPAVVGVAYARWRDVLGWRASGLVLLTVVAAGIVGWRLPVGLERQADATIDWNGIGMHLARFAFELRNLATQEPLPVLLIVAAPLLGGLVLRPPLRSSANAGSDMHRSATGFWWIVAVTAMATDVVATAMLYIDPPSFRYAGASFWWPVILTGMALARLLGRNAARVAVATVGAMTATLMVSYAWSGLHPPRILTWRNPLGACLLRASASHGLKAGLAGYWPARLIAAGTDWQLQVDQVTPDGQAYYWGNDRYWFVHDVHDGRAPPPYNFIVMNGLDEPVIRLRYGPPDRTIDCGGTPIWVYDDADRLRRVLAQYSGGLFAGLLRDGRPLCAPVAAITPLGADGERTAPCP